MFSGPQVCELTGVSYRMLDYWVRLDVIQPANAGGATPGSGRQREYTVEELFVTAVAADLIKLGMATTSAARLAAWLRMDAPHGRLFVDVDGYVLNEPVGACYIVDLDELRETLDARVAEITTTSR